MVVIGVDFSGKFPDAPPSYCVAVRGDRFRCVLMTGKAKRIVKSCRVPKAVATAAQVYYAVLPLVRQDDVVLIDAEYDVEYLRRVRMYLEKTLSVSSIAVRHVSDRAIEKADKLSKVFRKRKIAMRKALVFWNL